MANARKNAPNKTVRCAAKDELTGLQERLYFRQVERAGAVVEPQNGHQHQNRAEHGVQNEFHGRVDAALVAPHADHEVHGDQRQLPENKEKKKIERNEDADHRRLDDQDGDEEALHVFLNRFPGAENRERREESRQQNQEHADAVDTEVIVNGLADPGMELDELIFGRSRIVATQEEQGDEEFGQRRGQRDAANPCVVVGAQQQKSSNAQERQERDDR